MQGKQKSWLYAVLGLMLLSLVIFSALPIVGSVVEGEKFDSTSERQIATFSEIDLARLEAEAAGYEKVLQRESDNETALRGLINIRLEQKDLKNAIAPLEKLARLHPQQSEYSVLLAQAKQQIGDNEGAAAAYREILASDPGDILALRGMANLFLSQNLPERAIALLQDTIQLASSDTKKDSIDVTSVELLLGELYATRERYDEALSIYDKIANDNDNDFRPVLAKALVFKRQGQTDAAKPMLKTAYTLAPARYKDRISAEMKRLDQTAPKE
ncbi:tetratricopeptide repeat protein [Myxosarcina sp. GI1(2024)]